MSPAKQLVALDLDKYREIKEMVAEAEIIGKQVESLICLIRGQKVLLDEDLARLYQVPTKALTQAVKRNRSRFPGDFMFQLSAEEHELLRSQFVTSTGRTGRRYAPYVFTEHGVAMLSSVLNSGRAVHVNIQIIRAFIKLRQMMATNADLATKVAALESRYDRQFKVVFDAIREILNPEAKKVRKIGFGRDSET